jgi:hypothetical protein
LRETAALVRTLSRQGAKAQSLAGSGKDHMSQLWKTRSLALAAILICHGIAFSKGDASDSGRRPTKVITLERTVCFGACPNYKLTIFSDGRVSYEGIRFVKKMGKATGHVSRAKLDRLIEQFTNIYYFNLPDSFKPGDKTCPQVATDMPSATTSLTWRGRSKTITHYHGCSGASALELLTNLENKIDEAVNVKKWTGK